MVIKTYLFLWAALHIMRIYLGQGVTSELIRYYSLGFRKIDVLSQT
jgi:hypothetical protein